MSQVENKIVSLVADYIVAPLNGDLIQGLCLMVQESDGYHQVGIFVIGQEDWKFGVKLSEIVGDLAEQGIKPENSFDPFVKSSIRKHHQLPQQSDFQVALVYENRIPGHEKAMIQHIQKLVAGSGENQTAAKAIMKEITDIFESKYGVSIKNQVQNTADLIKKPGGRAA